MTAVPYMVEYEMKSNEGGTAVYFYYPDGDREHPGSVVVDTNAREIKSVVHSSADPLGRCCMRAVLKIDGMLSSGTLCESGSSSWG